MTDLSTYLGEPDIFADNTNIVDRIAQRATEARANQQAEAIAIHINMAGLEALFKDDRIHQHIVSPKQLLTRTFFGLPFTLIDDHPNDKYPHHWRFFLEYRARR